MKLVFIGPQGSGKGTQAKLLAAKLGVAHISTGDLLRNARGELKEKIENVINSGKLISDELMLDILKKRLKEEDCNKGFILDGFPRNLKQAEMLSSVTEIDKFVEIKISDEEALRRLSGRVHCEKCGAGFNTVTMPPKKEGICDKCGGKLVQREDDTEEAIKARLKTYHGQTELILEKYDHVKVNGEQSVEKVQAEILKALNI